jgi:hypothetical protein
LKKIIVGNVRIKCQSSKMADMWFPCLKKEWSTLFLFIMCIPPAN